MEYYKSDEAKNRVVCFKGTVYDVGDYMSTHPGGEEYISSRLGKVIDEDFENAEHTKSAYNIMKELPVIGSITSTEKSTSSDGENEDTAKKFGASALYGLKLDSKLNEKIKIDYGRGLLY